jgi:hypothetical protein
MKAQVIQIILIAFAVYAAISAISRFRRRSIGLAELAFWLALWAAAAAAVSHPELTQWVADRLGVGRGADAVFYFGLTALSYAFFRLYLRVRHAEQQITQLVRALALERPRRQEDA